MTEGCDGDSDMNGDGDDDFFLFDIHIVLFSETIGRAVLLAQKMDGTNAWEPAKMTKGDLNHADQEFESSQRSHRTLRGQSMSKTTSE